MIWQIVLGNLVFYVLLSIPVLIIGGIYGLWEKYKATIEGRRRIKDIINFLRCSPDLSKVDFNELVDVLEGKKDNIEQKQNESNDEKNQE